MHETRSTKRRVGGAALVAIALASLLGCSGDNTTGAQPTVASTPTSAEAPTTLTPTTTEAPATTAPPTTVAATTTATAATTTTTMSTTTMSTTTTTSPPAPAPSQPVVAVDASGDAVLIDAVDAAPVPLLGGDDPDGPPPAEGPGPLVIGGVAAGAEGNVWVGLCCEPAAGSVLELSRTGALVDAPTRFGRAPALQPTGRFLATAQINGFPVGLLDLATMSVVPGPAGDINARFEPHDTMWIDPGALAIVGSREVDGVPTIVVHHVTVGDGLFELAMGVVTSDDGETRFRFAGVPEPGRFALHAVGGASAAVHTFGDPQPPGAGLSLPGPSRSYWTTADGHEVWVDAAGVLRIDGTVVPGEYRWAR